MELRLNYNSIDIARMFMAFLVIGIHVKTRSICPTSVPYHIEFLMKAAVPFFFIVSGFFLQNKIMKNKNSINIFKKNLKKTTKLYFIWIVIYMPISIIHYFNNQHSFIYDLCHYFRGVLFVGETIYSWPLWYLLSLAVSIFIIYILNRINLTLPFIWIIGLCFMAFGHLLIVYNDSDIPLFNIICNLNNKIFTFPPNRNGLYYGLAHVTTGMMIRFLYMKIKFGYLLGAFLLLISFCMFTYDIPFFSLFEGIALFLIISSIRLKNNPLYNRIRIDSVFVYLLHMLIIYLMICICDPSTYKNTNFYLVWIVIFLITLIIADIINCIRKYKYFNWINSLIG